MNVPLAVTREFGTVLIRRRQAIDAVVATISKFGRAMLIRGILEEASYANHAGF